MSRKPPIKQSYTKQHNAGNAKKPAAVPKAESVKVSGFSQLHKQILFVIIACIGLYANTLDMDYTLDDTLMITGNSFTKKGIHGIGDIFTNDAFVGFLGKSNLLPGGRYRPLSQVMFAVEYQIFGFNPFIGHLLNVIFYTLLCLLLFKVLRMLFPEEDGKVKWYTIPFIATILFIAHPLHTEVVANIKGRDELMSMMGTLICLYLSLRYIETKKILHLAGSLILFILAILSKENALAWVVVIPFALWFFKKGTVRDRWISSLPLIAGIVVYAGIRAATVGFIIKDVNDTELLNNPFLGASFMEKYATIFLTWGKYFLLLLFPHPLTHDYYPKQIPIVGMGDWRAILSLLLSVASVVYAFVVLKKRKILSFAILFFWLTFAMSSNFVINIGAFMNERFMFAPLLGFTLSVAWLLNTKLREWIRNASGWSSSVLWILIILMGAYSIKTVTRNRVWKNDFILFTTDVEVSSNSAKCNTSAGGKLMEWSDSTSNPQKRQEYLMKSEKYLRKAIDIYPQNLNSWVLLGNVYIKEQKYSAARDCYDNCLRINPEHAISFNNLLHIAQVTTRDKLYEESVITYKDLLKHQPDSARYMFGIGYAYKGAGQFDSALVWFKRTLGKDSSYSDAWGKLGEIYGQQFNDLNTSEVYLKKAVHFNPKDASSLENLGIIYALRKNYAVSIEYFLKAYAITPDNPGLNRNLGKTYEDMGNKAKAAEYYQKANQSAQQKPGQ
jgi:Tfp pilus assembly protein PilF